MQHHLFFFPYVEKEVRFFGVLRKLLNIIFDSKVSF